MRHILAIGLCLCALATLVTGCTTPVKKVTYSEAAGVPEDAHPAPFRLNRIIVALPLGHDLGNYGSQAMNFCFGNYEAERGLLTSNIDRASARKAFYQTMAGLGFDVTGSEDFLFEEEEDDDLLRTEFKIGARVVNARMDACYQEPGLLGSALNRRYGDKGKLYIEVEWSIFDNLRKTTVYKTRTEGYVDRSRANYEGLTLMFNEAFGMASHNLAADEAFRALMISGVRPPRSEWQQKQSQNDEARRKFDPQEKVWLPARAPFTTPAGARMDELRRIAVMVEAGSGHGSGFFITREGHILTNAHVVGDALRVRVVSAGKTEKMVAEVLRMDRARDVALLKLEDIPADLQITPLPLQPQWPAIGTEVYAIGAPMARQLQDTVARGIVSAHRRDFRIMGTRQNFIQADIETHAGNSGGPLLDQYGNLAGLSVAGYMQDNAGIGLNLFVPMDEALAVMDISPDKP